MTCIHSLVPSLSPPRAQGWGGGVFLCSCIRLYQKQPCEHVLHQSVVVHTPWQLHQTHELANSCAIISLSLLIAGCHLNPVTHSFKHQLFRSGQVRTVLSTSLYEVLFWQSAYQQQHVPDVVMKHVPGPCVCVSGRQSTQSVVVPLCMTIRCEYNDMAP